MGMQCLSGHGDAVDSGTIKGGTSPTSTPQSTYRTGKTAYYCMRGLDNILFQFIRKNISDKN